jgi:hypothetical protein
VDNNGKYDWFGFWVHFAFGVIAGIIAGLYVLAQTPYYNSPSWLPMILFGAGGALAGSVIAGIFRDDFWEQFLSFWRWW